MLNLSFVPEDYIKNIEFKRTNIFYFVLFAMIMAGLGGVFTTIKIRQQTLNKEEELLNTRLFQESEALIQVEELQAKRNKMWRTALTANKLIEPLPKSVLLAGLVNTLPDGASLLRLKLIQKQVTESVENIKPQANQYKMAQNDKSTSGQSEVPQKKLLITHIEIEGVAPSDVEVAKYIEQLDNSTLLDTVELVESKEYRLLTTPSQQSTRGAGPLLREFKLKATVKKEVHLTYHNAEEIILHNI